MKLLRIVLLFLALLAAPIAFEGWLNVRGPAPGPDPASEAAGRALLASVIDHHRASGLPERGVVRFRVACRSLFLSHLVVSAAVDPAGRSADFVVRRAGELDPQNSWISGEPGGAFRYDGASEQVTPSGSGPADRDIARNLESLAPSIVFWSLFPWILDDPKAAVWRLPEIIRDGAVVRRIAVRWPGEADWFQLEVDAARPKLLAFEFIDPRATVFLRWRGEFNGMQEIDGIGFPETLRFRPARLLLRILTGDNDLFVFRYGPIL